MPQLTVENPIPNAPAAGQAPPSPEVRSAGVTDRGRARPSNEDQFLIAELGRTLWVRESTLPQESTQQGRNRGYILLVADGMGGHRAGQVASALSVTSMEDFVVHLLRRVSHLQASDEQAVLKDFQAAVQQADLRIQEEAAHHPEFAGMGTTLTMAFVSGWKLFVVHAGDSRCYLFRNRGLQQLTEDHTVAAELARRGVIRPEEVPRHHYRHVLTNALGGDQPGVQVELHRVDLKAGDVVLLCTDGLTDRLRDDEIAAFLAAEREPRAACQRLVAQANDMGGQDNITAVVARFEQP